MRSLKLIIAITGVMFISLFTTKGLAESVKSANKRFFPSDNIKELKLKDATVDTVEKNKQSDNKAVKVSMTGEWSHIGNVADFADSIKRINVWLKVTRPKAGMLWLKVIDKNGAEYGDYFTKNNPNSMKGWTRLTWAGEKLNLLKWSEDQDGELSLPIKGVYLVFYPDDRSSSEKLEFELGAIEIQKSEGTVASWPRENTIKLKNKKSSLLIDTQGRFLDYNSGDLSKPVIPAILPWKVSFDNGLDIFADEAEKVEVKRKADNEALVSYSSRLVDIDIAVSLLENGVELTPLKVQNKSSFIIKNLECPTVAYYPIYSKKLKGLAPFWGGVAYLYNYLGKGGSPAFHCPQATHDLIILDQPGSSFGVYSVQPLSNVPFIGTGIGIIGNRAVKEKLTGLKHSFDLWIKAGGKDKLPPVRLIHGNKITDIFSAYRQDNGMNKWPDLKDRLPEKLKKKLPLSVHLKFGFGTNRDVLGRSPFEKSIDIVNALPAGPYLVEFVSYHGRGAAHDRDYPDFTDIATSLGGKEDFKKLIASIKKRGWLLSAYTNPTWWHDYSKGVKSLGGIEKIAIRDQDGKLHAESWVEVGYVIGLWRPEVQKFVSNMLKEFRDEYKMDMIFQDQYGTRSNCDFSEDFVNYPYGYYQSLVDMARCSSKVLPVSGEGVGMDRTFRYLSASMGFYLNTMSGGRNVNYDPGHKDKILIQWPFATMVLHDKIAFYPHNLDICVRTSENLSWVLAAGMNMHYRVSQLMKDREAGNGDDTLKALSHIQQKVASVAFGEKITDFDFVRLEQELTCTRYANGLVVWASHDQKPQKVTLKTGEVELAPHGFVAVINDIPISALLADKEHEAGVIFDWDEKLKKWKKVMLWKPWTIHGR